MRRLVLVLGDQLDPQASAFDGFDPAQDAVWMAEVAEESTHIPSGQPRTALFLSAMRHFAQALRTLGRPLHYTRLDDADNRGSLAAQLVHDLAQLQPRELVLTAPGDWRVLRALQAAAREAGLPLEIRDDRHFYTTVREFAAHAQGRKSLRMEYFYREQRRRHGVLMDGNEPAGGRWNYDSDNRQPFGPDGPGFLPQPPRFAPDAITQEVLTLVRTRFADHPGTLATFAWPVTREQALQALQAFITERLPHFGPWQDAIWPGEPWLYHAQLGAALNLKLLNPREVVAAAEAAYRAGQVPLASAEGFIRQILGWREYVRGIYWTQMPGYLEQNALDAHQPLPAWYWDGRTDLACLRDAITQTLQHGYAHHIQRLMVTGLYALLLGVEPREIHAWYLGVYVDAVEWVELPNTLGMSQHADGGLMASKPYIASGKYIERMSPLCRGCRYDPAQRTGERACPITTLYWDFLLRHEARLAANPRTALQVKNLARLDATERQAVQERAAAIRRGAIGALP
ncbi:MAG: cryptochrome/photolyase family protein [Hylemonella sp.]|uniref:cryptochrome/photolyase family protein n=1 Tax=Hylemonella sp. TaxID=2066020 RepID=UPI00391C1B46